MSHDNNNTSNIKCLDAHRTEVTGMPLPLSQTSRLRYSKVVRLASMSAEDPRFTEILEEQLKEARAVFGAALSFVATEAHKASNSKKPSLALAECKVRQINETLTKLCIAVTEEEREILTHYGVEID